MSNDSIQEESEEVYIYYCWITVLLPSYQDKIVAGLVKHGYMVGPASKDGKVAVTSENSAATLIALSIYRPNGEETDVNKIYEDVLGILKEMKAYYFSVIISHSYEATWVGSNFTVPKPKAADKPPPPTSGGKKNVN